MGIAAVLGLLDPFVNAIKTIRSVVTYPGRQRELAGTRLHVAVDEIAKSFEAIESQLVRLLQSDLASPSGRNVLIELEGGSAQIRLATMRGHCSIIWRIWKDDLENVFQKITPNEFGNIEQAFQALHDVDGVMLSIARELTEFTASEASDILDLLDNGQTADAQRRIQKARADVRGLRMRVNESLAEMVELRFVLREGNSH